MLTARWIDRSISYDGSQLKSHWIFDSFEILGDAVVAFVGPCHVPTCSLVDKLDARQGLHIFSESMLHFIGELFERDLSKTILRQRLLIATIGHLLEHRTSRQIRRRGNDLFDGEAKLTVAIATLSPISTVFHVGLNVVSRNTPVPTRGLEDYHIEPAPMARSILENFLEDWNAIELARVKVKGVP